ncbi:hypothetical protein [Streptomyces sp. NRRL F-5630]|uniref:hypothetical protein n=1 Tax=Streptomyces sp. NRRL F-5630 TaxID=1463864 RepID=UPI003D760E6F
MGFMRSWGIGLVAATLIGGGAAMANAASGDSSHDSGNQPAAVLPGGDGSGTSAGDPQAHPLPEGDTPGTPADDETYRLPGGDPQAHPLPEGDTPGTPADDETYHL